MPRDRIPLSPRHPLIICASLVENPMNLGALCRTMEAFCLEMLVLADGAIPHNREFRKLAASAHHWQPITICPVDRLDSWLTQQAQANYRILGLTVNAEAIPLTRLAFPQKTVLLLGRELTGIPPQFLARCDGTLTISQYGMVDSLNVQTAAAIASYEYIRQWGMVSPP